MQVYTLLFRFMFTFFYWIAVCLFVCLFISWKGYTNDSFIPHMGEYDVIFSLNSN